MSTPSRTTETQTFLTPRDVSELLRVFACSVRRWINMGDLPAHKVGRDWRIRREAVAEWLARHQQPGVRRLATVN